MKISINGNQTEIAENATITEVLNQVGLTGKPVVVELNKTAILPRLFTETQLQPEDSLEIITLAAGG